MVYISRKKVKNKFIYANKVVKIVTFGHAVLKINYLIKL